MGQSIELLVPERLELLVPERFRQGHQKHRGTYYAEPPFRPIDTGLKLYARRKDGTEFPADINWKHLGSIS